MKKQISGEAKVDFNTYRRFSQFQMFKGKNPALKRKMFYGSLAASAFALIVLGLVFSDITFLILGAVDVLFMVWFSYSAKQTFKKQCEMNHRLLNATQVFVFAPDGLVMELKDEGLSSREEIFYSDIFIIYEVRDAFYLYADKTKAFIVPKSCFTKDTPEQIREFLKSKVSDDKYIYVR